MSAEAKNLPIDDDINTTMPQPKPEVWKMPEPVFRRTSGRLPKGFVEEPTRERVSVEEEPPATIASIVVEPKPKSPVLKIIVVGLAIAAMIAFLIVFLTIVYFFFLRDASAPPPV